MRGLPCGAPSTTKTVEKAIARLKEIAVEQSERQRVRRAVVEPTHRDARRIDRRGLDNAFHCYKVNAARGSGNFAGFVSPPQNFGFASQQLAFSAQHH
jgi:hypothetical protein